MKRGLLMTLGYVLMLTVAIPAGIMWLLSELFGAIHHVFSRTFDFLEHLLDQICLWDKENRK